MFTSSCYQGRDIGKLSAFLFSSLSLLQKSVFVIEGSKAGAEGGHTVLFLQQGICKGVLFSQVVSNMLADSHPHISLFL